MVTFTLNGIVHSLDVPDDTPLLWVIRDELKLKGTKFGCGMGLCGACTVHLNGQAIRSCITPVATINGQRLMTIEGLGTPEQPHPLQKAWVQHSVPQCGYCQSGQLMSASALLAANPHPTEAQIREAMSGNVCRCGTYPRILKAIQTVTNAMTGEEETL
ncbi:MAG: (2Fe-2S)-binding protein [Hahellaceae bacterium]|nr:(2Fe-2S)-binding protein [Hahellaceae bacterium]